MTVATVRRTKGPAVAKLFTNFRHTKGPAAGKTFTLEPWQQDDTDLMFELDARGRRQWRSILYGVPRGCGKSPLVAGFGLAEMMARDDEPDVFCAAGKREQAGIVQGFAGSFVKGSPLEARCSVFANSITCSTNGGSMRTVSADGTLAHGLSVSAALRDEKHAWVTPKQEELHWALATATHKREDSVEYDITTAGWDKRTLLGEQYDANVASMELEWSDDRCRLVGRDVEGRSLMIWRGAPEDADVSDPRVWRACMPASWVPDEEIARLARTLPENVFRRLILNQWTEAESTWLPLGAWDACRDADRHVDADEPVVLAFCGRYQNDGASLVGCTLGDRPHVFTIRVWEPEHGQEGFQIKPKAIESAVAGAMATRNVVALVADELGFVDEVAQWKQAYGSIVETPITEDGRPKNRRSFMTKACSRFFSDVVAHELSQDGNRVTGRHLAQCDGKDGDGGTYITVDPDSGLHIDAAVAAILAHDRAVDGDGGEPWMLRW
jgi:hypothetical protein